MFQTIQACRAMAALLVLLFHTANTLAKPKYFDTAADNIAHIFWFGGDAGVAFFFVLSGFIIMHVHGQDIGHPERLNSYARKRAIRIYPTYWIIFFAVYGIAMLTPSLRDGLPTDLVVLLKSILLLPQDRNLVGGTGAPLIVVAWSLQYELMFYCAFGMAIFNRIAPPAIGFAFVVNAFFCLTSHKEVFPFIFFANHLMVLFGFGVITSIATKKYKITSHTRLAIFISSMMFCAICIAATALQAEEYKKPLFDTLFGLSSACLVFSLVQHESMVARLSMPAWTLKLGDTSYALYLIHFPMVSILSKLSERVLTKTTANAWMSLILICATCILASMVFHQWIERPLLRRLTSKYSLPARQCQKTITKP